jgi:hypothetical protein
MTAPAERGRRAQQARERRKRNPQPHRDANRRWREANPEKVREMARTYGPGYARANQEKRNGQARARYATDLDQSRERNRQRGARVRHGPNIVQAFAEMWQEQNGRCYLCGIYLVPESRFTVIDHDHRCCPRNRSCPACRRGITCDKCNVLVGLADDDPTLLRQIADNLEAKLAAMGARIPGGAR